MSTLNVATVNATTTLNTSSINGGQLGGFRNRIINGNFNIAQRGTSFAAVSHNEYTLDRWKFNNTGTGEVTISQDTDTPNEYFEYSLKIDCTTADTSIDAGDIYALQQKIEGYNVQDFGLGTSDAKTITVSFWVKSTKTGIFSLALKNSAADRAYVAEYTVSTTDTWEYKTVTIALDQTGTWLRTNGIGLAVMFTLACGTTRQVSAINTWEAGNLSSSPSQVNALDSTSNNFFLCGVQVEIGSDATPFEQRGIGTELALCQRYYQEGRVGMKSTAGESSGQVSHFERFMTLMRAAPSITLSNVASQNTSSGTVSGSTTAYGFEYEINISSGNWYRFDNFKSSAEL